jgi:Mg-chelatase subunit ChlD
VVLSENTADPERRISMWIPVVDASGSVATRIPGPSAQEPS